MITVITNEAEDTTLLSTFFDKEGYLDAANRHADNKESCFPYSLPPNQNRSRN